MKKLIMGLVATTAIFVGNGLQVEAAKNFSDVNTNMSSYEAIQQVANAGYISGYPDGSFKPDKSISRAEVASILNQYLQDEGRITTNEDKNTFTDVSNSSWYAQAIKNVTKLGIIVGDGKGHFRPNDTITRAELAAMVNRMENYQLNGTYFLYADIPYESWYALDTMVAYSNGIMKGTSSSKFEPNLKATRELFAVTLNNVLNYDPNYVAPDLAMSNRGDVNKDGKINDRDTNYQFRQERFVRVKYYFSKYGMNSFVDGHSLVLDYTNKDNNWISGIYQATLFLDDYAGYIEVAINEQDFTENDLNQLSSVFSEISGIEKDEIYEAIQASFIRPYNEYYVHNRVFFSDELIEYLYVVDDLELRPIEGKFNTKQMICFSYLEGRN